MTTTPTDPNLDIRVFWPGDELPQGIYVMARDGSVAHVDFPGTKVRPSQPDPLVEVALPDFGVVTRLDYGRRYYRTEPV